MSVIERVFALEQRASRLETRLAALEEGRRLPADDPRRLPVEPPRPAPPPRTFAPPVAPPPAPPARPEPPLRPEPSPRPPAPSLEDLLGGRVLAWAGALSLLAGLHFLLVIAVSRDWIGEEARTVLAAATSLALLALGARTYERRGRTDSALAATATGIAGLFASVIVATQGYELIPVAAGLAIAFAVAATATWLAIRWEARGIATLGILGAVAAPILVGAGLASVSVARPGSGSSASRTSSSWRRPCSASCSRTSRSPRRSTACRWWPAGPPPASRSPCSPAGWRTASTASSRSPASAPTSPSRSGTR